MALLAAAYLLAVALVRALSVVVRRLVLPPLVALAALHRQQRRASEATAASPAAGLEAGAHPSQAARRPQAEQEAVALSS